MKNNFERAHFSVKFKVVGGGGKIMAVCGWWRQNYGWSWVVVGGRGWSHDLVIMSLVNSLNMIFEGEII